MKPMVHGLEQEYWGQVEFVYLNIDDPATEAVKDQYAFRYQPYFVFITPDGSVVWQWQGFAREDDFRQVLDEYLASTGG